MANIEHDLKTENPKAVEYFMNRGRKYLKLKAGFENDEIKGTEMGDFSMNDIKTWAAQVKGEFEKKGIEAVNKLQEVWEKYVKAYEIELKDPKTAPAKKATIQRKLNDAIMYLNLINLFKNIYVTLQENKEKANVGAKGIDEAADRMINALKDNKVSEFNIANSDFSTAISLYVESISGYESAAEAYKQSTLIDLPRLNIAPISENKAEILYTALASSIKSLKEQANSNPAQKPEIDARISKLNETVDKLSKIVGKTLFDQIKNRVDQRLNTTQTKSTTNEFDEFKNKLLMVYNKMYLAYINCFKKPNWPMNEYYAVIAEKNNLISVEYAKLGPEKNELDKKCLVDLSKLVKNYFGEELYAAMTLIKDAAKKTSDVNKLADDQITLANENEILALINKVRECDLAKKGQLKITQNGNNVEFEFADKRVANFKMPLLRENVYNKLHSQSQQKGTGTGTGTQSTPTGQSQKTGTQTDGTQSTNNQGTNESQDIEYYLSLLRETNALIANINDINRQLVISNKFSELNMASILADVQAENTARYSSILLTSKKLELSEKRFEYLKKYGKYILSNDTVKKAKLEDIKFGTGLEDFLNKRDELIVDAELEIANLQAAKPEGYEQQTQNLLEFIKAQNSVIRRFLIAESATKDIDMISLLEQRNANRKAIKEAKMKSRATTQQQTADTQQQKATTPDQKNGTKSSTDMGGQATTSQTTTDEYKEFREKLKAAYDKMYQAYIKCMSTPNWPMGEFKAATSEKDSLLFVDYANLGAEKFKYEQEFRVALPGAIEKYFGAELYAAISLVRKASVKTGDVNKLADDQITAEKENEIYAVVNEVKSCELAKKGLLKVTQNGNNVEFEFADNRVAKFKMPVLRENVYKKLHAQAQNNNQQQTAGTQQQKATTPDQTQTITHEKHVVKETKLRFNPRNDQKVAKKVTSNDRLFQNSPRIISSLIKNGVRIQLSEQLKARLAELNAKIALVNKENKRIRTQQAVNAEAEYQDLAFKQDHDVNLDDYTVEVRIPDGKNSQLLFSTDDEVIHKSR